jgi:phage gp45-like
MFDEHDDGLRSSTRRARIVKVDDSQSQQRVDVKGLKSEMPKKIWHAMPFGFTTNPPQDSDGVFDQMGSRSDRSLYFDAGHEKYRPKNTPSGCMAIFNQFGDIVRIFKDNADVVHQKQVNIRVGHGYNAGSSGDSGTPSTQIDDQQNKDTTTISIVLNGSAITLTYSGSTVTIDNAGNVTAQASNRFAGGVNGGKWVVARAGRVDLGVSSPDEQAGPAVETTAGPSSIVFAVV